MKAKKNASRWINSASRRSLMFDSLPISPCRGQPGHLVHFFVYRRRAALRIGDLTIVRLMTPAS